MRTPPVSLGVFCPFVRKIKHLPIRVPRDLRIACADQHSLTRRFLAQKIQCPEERRITKRDIAREARPRIAEIHDKNDAETEGKHSIELGLAEPLGQELFRQSQRRQDRQKRQGGGHQPRPFISVATEPQDDRQAGEQAMQGKPLSLPHRPENP